MCALASPIAVMVLLFTVLSCCFAFQYVRVECILINSDLLTDYFDFLQMHDSFVIRVNNSPLLCGHEEN